MKTTIGKYDPASGTVAVTFRAGAIIHKRAVNACFDEAGAYHAAATRLRVADVGRGVTAKIAAGAIAAPKPASSKS